ncbi:transmembrane protein [Arabidopsis thaliana]|uniref:Transmembrane protein n=1 Tax=Arabidopsis thaliana TaxID=3702 RepID=A8MQG6_ARATH|nr:uncharacterized protein AT4G03298 [Arabidopsis thaliana]AEE82305.1 transmembrane protein [Arabidopsis thaliana]|eukprot:NP_001078349.1 transmembrane protein [Arabidopsis thaliana]
MVTTTDRISLTFLASRNQSPSYLKKYLKPTSLCCFSNFGSPFPKSRLTIISSLQRKIVPLLDVDVASPSPFNQIFVHDRRLTKPVSTLRASKDGNSIPSIAANVLLKRLFLTFNIIIGMLLFAINDFFPLIKLNERLGMSYMMVLCFSCIWCLVDSLVFVMAGIYRLIHVICATFNWPVLRSLFYYSFVVLKELFLFYCKLRICEFCLGMCSFVIMVSSFK